MRLTLLALLTCLLAPWTYCQEEIPPQFAYGEGIPKPLWVSAEAAVTKDGEMNYDLFHSPSMRQYREAHAKQYRLTSKENQSDISWEECFQVERRVPKPPSIKGRPANTLDDLVQHSDAIIEGTIVQVTPGFLVGHQTSLVTVQVSDRLKRSPDFREQEYLYVDYPVAKFTVGGITYCIDNAELPIGPKIGARVLLFPYRKPWDTTGSFLTIEPKQIFIEDLDGKLLEPKALDSSTSLGQEATFSDLLHAVSSRVSQIQVQKDE
jgi:hypothetical protein